MTKMLVLNPKNCKKITPPPLLENFIKFIHFYEYRPPKGKLLRQAGGKTSLKKEEKFGISFSNRKLEGFPLLLWQGSQTWAEVECVIPQYNNLNI